MFVLRNQVSELNDLPSHTAGPELGLQPGPLISTLWMAACFLRQQRCHLPTVRRKAHSGLELSLSFRSGCGNSTSMSQTPVRARPRQWRAAPSPACPLPMPAHLLVWWFGSALTVPRVVYSFANLLCERIPTGCIPARGDSSQSLWPG